MFNKNKFKGGLLSDIVSPEVLEEMTTSEESTENKNTEAKPAAETTPATDDASWKSRISEPATENTDESNQAGCKSKNQSEYAEEIGLVEATQILSDIEINIEKKEVAGEEVPSEQVELVESMQTAIEATSEIVEQKDIMDEAVASDELTPTAVSIFKENCENYLEKVDGENTNKSGETVPYIDSESAGLESDSNPADSESIYGTVSPDSFVFSPSTFSR